MAILGDGSIPDGAVAIKIDVDTVISMKGKGQYIYVTVAASEAAAGATRPTVMFDNGHSSELFGQGYEQNAGGMFQGLYEAKIKPALHKLLA